MSLWMRFLIFLSQNLPWLGIQDPRWQPDSEAHYDRGDGTCFHCHQLLTQDDPGLSPPDQPQQQIHNRCIAELKQQQDKTRQEIYDHLRAVGLLRH